jgi:hypothetical protein
MKMLFSYVCIITLATSFALADSSTPPSKDSTPDKKPVSSSTASTDGTAKPSASPVDPSKPTAAIPPGSNMSQH